jgi:tRNA (guanine-N7-)-methyltransferase
MGGKVLPKNGENQTGFRRPQINLTRNLKHQNEYTLALDNECRDYAFNEERAPLNKGLWRSQVFGVGEDVPVNLEIGTGNGKHFQLQVGRNPTECFVGVELKYKPLIQTIRGALKAGNKNARICRYHAFNIDLLFTENELNNIYIHFPDPWVSPRKPKNRFVNRNVLFWLYGMQRPGSFVEFKTDSREYFLWALEEIEHTPYKTEFQTLDLHRSEKAADNFITQFERIFSSQGVEINYIKLIK